MELHFTLSILDGFLHFEKRNWRQNLKFKKKSFFTSKFYLLVKKFVILKIATTNFFRENFVICYDKIK